MKLYDIAQLHRKHANPRVFSHFFLSAGYKKVHTYLKSTQVPDSEILIRSMPSKGHPSMAKVHPLVLLEYIRWADYPKYASLAKSILAHTHE